MATVLVAEDDRDIRELVRLKLEQQGHTVTAVADGASAVDAARLRRPDIAVLDVLMPLMTGLEVRRALRASPDTATVPVILMTARARESDVAAELAATGTTPLDQTYLYVTKPFSPGELAGRVTAALAGSAAGPS